MPKTNAMQKAREIAHSSESDVERHLSALGGWDGVEVLHSQVVGLTYVQAAVTAGGIHLPDNAIEEDRFQGKVFLAIDMGPGAFKDDKIAQFHGKALKKLSWFMARPSDGLELFYNGNSIRIFQDVDIRMIVDDPRAFW
jgi:co-chaperonin GroES (HSP10)